MASNPGLNVKYFQQYASPMNVSLEGLRRSTHELASSRQRYSSSDLNMAEKILSNFKIDINPDMKDAFKVLFEDIYNNRDMVNILIRSNLLRNNIPREVPQEYRSIPNNGTRRSLKTWIDKAYLNMLEERSLKPEMQRNIFVNRIVFKFINTIIQKLNLLISFTPPFIATPETIDQIITLRGVFNAIMIYFLYKFCNNVLLDNRFINKRNEAYMGRIALELNMPRVPGQLPLKKKDLKSVDDIQIEVMNMSLPRNPPTFGGKKKSIKKKITTKK